MRAAQRRPRGPGRCVRACGLRPAASMAARIRALSRAPPRQRRGRPRAPCPARCPAGRRYRARRRPPAAGVGQAEEGCQCGAQAQHDEQAAALRPRSARPSPPRSPASAAGTGATPPSGSKSCAEDRIAQGRCQRLHGHQRHRAHGGDDGGEGQHARGGRGAQRRGRAGGPRVAATVEPSARP